MSPRTVFLSRLIGLYCIVAALSMFLRGQSMLSTVALSSASGALETSGGFDVPGEWKEIECGERS